MTQPDQPAETLGRRLRSRWGLLILTALGVLFAGVAPFQNWYSNVLIVWKAGAKDDYQGITHFGAWGIGFGIGIVVLAVLVLVAVVAPQRLATPLAFAALGVAAILVADLVVMAAALNKARLVSADAAASLAAAANSKVKIYVSSQGMQLGVAAVGLLGLVAAQLPRRDLAPRVVAGIASSFGVLSLALPWVTAYVEVDGDLRLHRYWVFNAPALVVALGVGLLLVIGLAGALAVLPRTPMPVLFAAIVVGLVTLLPVEFDLPGSQIDQQHAGQRLLSLEAGIAVMMSEVASLLVMVAAIRLAWRGYRERRSTSQAGRVAGAPTGHPVPSGARPVAGQTPVHAGNAAPVGGRPMPPGRPPMPPVGQPTPSAGRPVPPSGQPTHSVGRPVPPNGPPTAPA